MITRRFLLRCANVLMIIDHITWYFVLYPSVGYTVIHTVTRISAPVFFFNAGMNIEKTKDLDKYLLRLFTLTILSAIPYSFYQVIGNLIHFKLLPTSVVLNIFLAVLLIKIIKTKMHLVIKLISAIIILKLSYYGEWRISSIFLILVAWYFRGNAYLQAMTSLAILFIFVIVPNYYQIGAMFQGINFYHWGTLFFPLIIPFVGPDLHGGKRNTEKVIDYLLYPIHLILITVFYSLIQR